MEFEELKTALHAVAQRTQDIDHVLLGMHTEKTVGRVQRRLRGLWLGQSVQLMVGLLVVLGAGSSAWENRDTPVLLGCAVLVHLYGVLLIGFAVSQMMRLTQLDLAAPVLNAQRALMNIRTVRFHASRALLMGGFVVWAPLCLLVMASIGMRFQTLGTYGLANIGAGLLLAAAVMLFAHRRRNDFDDDAAGSALREAQRELDEFARG